MHQRHSLKDETVSPPAPSVALTARQREVLQLIAEGKTTIEIAAMLRLSAKTIETHRSGLMERLQTHSVADLTKHALLEGLTSLES